MGWIVSTEVRFQKLYYKKGQTGRGQTGENKNITESKQVILMAGDRSWQAANNQELYNSPRSKQPRQKKREKE